MVLGVLGQKVSVLLDRGLGEDGLGPQVRGQEGVGLSKSMVDSHSQVTSGTGVTSGGGVDILNTSHVHELLWDDGSDDTRTTRSRDQAGADRAALAGDLAWDSVWSTSVQTPVTSADRNQVHLGVDDTTTDGSSNFLSALDTKTDVAVGITDSDVALEAGALTGSGLLLDRHDLHDLILQGITEQGVDDLVFLDWEGEQEDLFDALDLSVLDQTTKLGDRSPLVLLLALWSARTTTTATATFTVTTSVTANKLISIPFAYASIRNLTCHHGHVQNHPFSLQ